MVKLTRLNGSEIVINVDMIETLEATPDTVVSLTSDRKWIVRESIEEVIDRVVAFKRSVHAHGPLV
ncbi:MAG: flagellar FlbD family protein [Candidatus Sericytochromatia bacterium]